MIDHKNHCSVALTGKCNCQSVTVPKRIERWTDGNQTLIMDVNILDETVVCSYETLAALLVRVGIVKSNADVTP